MAMEAAAAYTAADITGGGELEGAALTGAGTLTPSDVLGSYTGLAIEGTPFELLDMVYLEDERPVQDADDL